MRRKDGRLHAGGAGQFRRRLRQRPRFHPPGHAASARRAHREGRPGLVDRGRDRRLRAGARAPASRPPAWPCRRCSNGARRPARPRKALSYIASKKDASGHLGHHAGHHHGAAGAAALHRKRARADVRGTVEVTLNGKPVEKLDADAGQQRPAAPVRVQGHRCARRQYGGASIRRQGRPGLPGGGHATSSRGTRSRPNEPLSIDVAYDRTQPGAGRYRHRHRDREEQSGPSPPTW